MDYNLTLTLTNAYYYTPTQVIFWDTDNQEWVGGIANENYIICGCCGSTFEIEELLESYSAAEANGEFVPDVPIQEYDNWVNISKEIIGN